MNKKWAIELICVTILLTILARGGEGAGRSVYPLVGTLVHLDRQTLHATIAHETIPGYMPAMTMEFEVHDCAELNTASEGNRIESSLIVEGDRAWIENFHILNRASTLAPNGASNCTELAEGSMAPDIQLMTSSGNVLRLDQLRGRSIAMSFIYTRCPMPGYCPLINRNFQLAQRMIRTTVEGPEYLFLSITIDPIFDTPGVLAAFSSKLGADPATWIFATGEPAAIKTFSAAFGLASNQSDGTIHHTLRTVVIDPSGKVFRIFRGNTWKPEALVDALSKSHHVLVQGPPNPRAPPFR